MPPWIIRSCIAFHVASVGLLALAFAHVQPLKLFLESGRLTTMAILFLGFVCGGFISRLLHGWSTRFLWEWMFMSALFLGGWLLPKGMAPNVWGTLLGAIVVSSPSLFTHTAIRLIAFLISAAGAGVFLAAYVPVLPLWILWGGLTVHDEWGRGNFQKLVEMLSTLGKKRRLLTSMPTGEEKVVILASHVVLPAALIAQATWRSLPHGGVLLAALLIGAWYAMMRPVSERTATILPWAMIWMAGAEILLQVAERLL